MTDKTTAIELHSTLRCPFCAQTQVETMPTDYCQFFYQCRHCDKIMRPRLGEVPADPGGLKLLPLTWRS